MTQTVSLNEIVRQVPDHVAPKSGYEQRVTINTETSQAIDDVGFFQSLIGNFKYFMVANNRNPQKAISGRKPLKYREGTGEVVFNIDYKGGCPPGREMQLAQFFFRTPEPDKAISDSLGKWMIEYFSTNGRRMDQFYIAKEGAEQDLAHKAVNEFGLALTITLKVETSTPSNTVEIGPLVIASRLLGSDEEEKLSIKAELEVDPQNVLRAMLNNKTSFTDLVKKGVKQYLAGHVDLQAYYDDINSDPIKRGLRAHLNNLLHPFGRRVAFISLKTGDGGIPPGSYNDDKFVEYNHHECTKPIKIKFSILMTPSNPARYRGKGSPELSAWSQRNLEEVTRKVLFGFSYVQLLLDFSGAKQKIIDDMKQRAEAIGYRMEQLMTMLSMEPMSWRKRIDVEIKNTKEKPDEAMFETSLSGVYVGLEIFLTARVKDLRGISRRYLTIDIRQPMKEEIVRLVQKTLHATDPEHFYKYYREGDKRKRSSGGPLETELRQRICYLLESEFNAEVIQLDLKPTKTDLTDKIYPVAKTSHSFEATSEIGTSPGAPKITVHGSFTVESVTPDGWETFRERDVSAALLTKRVVDAVTSSLKLTPDELAVLPSHSDVFNLIDRCLRSARKLIEEEFGLSIKLTTISWDWDENLKKIGRDRNEADVVAIQNRISRQKEILLDLYEHNGSQEAIDRTRSAITRLSAMLPANLTSSIGYRELPEPPAVKELAAAETDSVNSQ